MVLRNVSDQMVCNVAGHTVRNVSESGSEGVPKTDSDSGSEMVRNGAEQVRNVSGQVCSETVRNVSGRKLSDIGGFRTRVRNVSGSGSEMVPDVGHQVPMVSDVGGQVSLVPDVGGQ